MQGGRSCLPLGWSSAFSAAATASS